MKLNSRKQVVLITGASTGVGLELVKLMRTAPDLHIIATARESSLPRFAAMGITEQDNLWLRPMDVLNKKDRDQVLNEANQNFGGIDILVNNAAYMLRAVVEHVAEMERFQQIDTNFRAPMALVRAVLPSMRQKRSGHIINISSVGGMMAMPTMAVYSASKFALEGATESLWYEVKPWNIRVTLVQPGFINSDGHLNVKQSKECLRSIENLSDPYHMHYSSMVKFITQLMRWTPATSEKVAKVIYKTIRKKNNKLRVCATIDAHLFYVLRRFLPRQLYHECLYRLLPRIDRWGKNGSI